MKRFWWLLLVLAGCNSGVPQRKTIPVTDYPDKPDICSIIRSGAWWTMYECRPNPNVTCWIARTGGNGGESMQCLPNKDFAQ